MVKIIQKHVRLLIIILVGTNIILLFHTMPVEALEDNQPKSPPLEKGIQMFPFYWVIIIVGGCIAITLTYVSWRKYKVEKKNEKSKNIQKNKGSNS